MFSSCQPRENVRLLETVEVDHEVEVPTPQIASESYNLAYRTELRPITQFDSIDRNDLVGKTRQFDDLTSGLSGQCGDLSFGKLVADSTQCGQSQHDVAELAKMDNENVLEVVLSLSQAAILHH